MFTEYYRKIKDTEREIETLKAIKLRMFDECCSANCNLSDIKVQTSKGNSSEDKLIAYAEASKNLDNRIKDLIELQSEAMHFINQLDNEVQRIVLLKRYIMGYMFSDIAEELNYSLRHIYNIHKQAINQIEKECI